MSGPGLDLSGHPLHLTELTCFCLDTKYKHKVLDGFVWARAGSVWSSRNCLGGGVLFLSGPEWSTGEGAGRDELGGVGLVGWNCVLTRHACLICWHEDLFGPS